MNTKQLIGVRIRELRSKRGFTQEQLAEGTGINPKYVSSIERGGANPTLDIFIKVAEALEASIGEIFCELETENPEQRLQNIQTLLEKAPADQQRMALNILSALLR